MKKSNRRIYTNGTIINKAAGGAKKSSLTSYSYRDGDNELRLVGDVLARYVYWLEGKNGKNIPFECLSFDRNEEALQ